jgi:hypothetical protein
MASMAVTFWAGCKKDDVSAFAEAENNTPFKGKAMTITAAKAHYEKTQKALHGISFRSGESDVDWENAVIDTAANGQVEVIAPVKGWEYSGNDGRKWAINTKFEYDGNGNPVGNYAIVTHDIGNTSDEWATFSGSVWYFGMDKKYQEGYHYDNGVPVPVNLIFEDSLGDGLSGYSRDCEKICEENLSDWRPSTQTNTQEGKYNNNNQISAACRPYYYCPLTGSGAGNGGGFAPGVNVGTGSGGSYTGAGSGGNTGGTSHSLLSSAEKLMYESFLESAGIPPWWGGTHVKNAITCQNPLPTTASGVNSALIKCQIKNQLAITNTAQLAFLEANPGVVYQMWCSSKGMVNYYGYTVAEMQVILQNHIQQCMTNNTYRISNASLSYPTCPGNNWFWVAKYNTTEQWQDEAIDPTNVRPCAAAVLDKVKNMSCNTSSSNYANGLSGFLRRFSGENGLPAMQHDLIVQEANIGYGNNAATIGPRTTLAGITKDPTRPNAVYMGLNPQYLNTMTELSMVRIYMHEMLHAYFLVPSPNESSNIQKIRMVLYGGSPGIISTDAADHNLLADNYIQTMASFLDNYAFTNNIAIPTNHSGTIQDRKAYFEALSWGGLADTQAFKQKYRNSQGQLNAAGQKVVNIIHCDDHFVTNTSTTPGGNNCPNGECSTQKLCQ